MMLPSEQIIDNLQVLCACPSISGNLPELDKTGRLVADMVRRAGLEARLVRTAGAPIILGWRAGRRPYTLLLYHHYDVAPPGPWRAWQHDPFQLAERDGCLYGRGVSAGKGPLAAHLHAIQSLLALEGDLPHGIVLLIEGEALNGSTYLDSMVRRYADKVHVNAALGSAGERDASGNPFCYSGSKGLLRVRLTARGPAFPLAPGLATSVPNPVWRLIWALGNIKGADEDIRINGFYDTVEGPDNATRAILRQAHVDEESRRTAWDIPEFLFGMSGASLIRTDVTLPSCNVSSFVVEPPGATAASIPTRASAQLDFQLVPQQQPEDVFALLRDHLRERLFHDIAIEKLPGGYAPIQCGTEHRLMHDLIRACEHLNGAPPAILPMGTFVQPLHIIARSLQVPAATVGLARHTSSVCGPNEHLPLDDLLRHGELLLDLMLMVGECEREVALPG